MMGEPNSETVKGPANPTQPFASVTDRVYVPVVIFNRSIPVPTIEAPSVH